MTTAATTAFTLEVRCASQPGCIDRAPVTVTVRPDASPPDLGNSRRAVRADPDVELSWRAEPLAASYRLHRSETKGQWPPVPHRAGLALPGAREPDLAPPPSLLFYRAAGESCSGVPGP